MNHISSFVRMDPNERFEREYFIAHSTMKRFRLWQLNLIALVFFLGFLLGMVATEVLRFRPREGPMIGIVIGLVAAALMVAYLCLRKLKISYGYATVTDRRLLYYEYSDHEAVNYHFVKSLYLADITAVQFRIERSLFRKAFGMAAFTEFKALGIGAESKQGWLSIFNLEKRLEPGPDALEFIQQVSGEIAARKFSPESGSRMSTV
jgi:uncharacterized membrane protein YeaQ/YmgE (transglycosylase-associated protein family)